ncbi:hypothetical protein SAMN04488121_101185 [Chitinophaga filiformis]|uniref:Uncharacterized protein n=1 Tax=Chitinophaga filiformis TaxID=104663 RepID=A0A1G7GW99_CHIFI|nr:hypothetical protein SAMN04488121_101185 [Chitinophaga filiformis]
MLGAIAVQLLEIVETSKIDYPKKPTYKSIEFYILTVASILMDTIVGYIYFDNQHTYNRIVYFHTGASAPLIVRMISNKLPAAVNAKLKESESNSIT